MMITLSDPLIISYNYIYIISLVCILIQDLYTYICSPILFAYLCLLCIVIQHEQFISVSTSPKLSP